MKRVLINYKVISQYTEYNCNILHHGIDDLWAYIDGNIIKADNYKTLMDKVYNYCKEFNYDYIPGQLQTKLTLYKLNGNKFKTFNNVNTAEFYDIAINHIKDHFINYKEVI